MFSQLLALILALATSFSLSVSPSTIKPGEDTDFNVVVKGPIEGLVCVVVYVEPDEDNAVGHMCPSALSELDLKEGQQAAATWVSTTTQPGDYLFRIAVVDDDGPHFLKEPSAKVHVSKPE